MSNDNELLKQSKHESGTTIKKTTLKSKRKYNEKAISFKKETNMHYSKNETERFSQSSIHAPESSFKTVEIDSIVNVLEQHDKNISMSTAKKDIFSYVVSNEYVLSMVQNTAYFNSSHDNGKEFSPIINEPKFTRSKAKEINLKQSKNENNAGSASKNVILGLSLYKAESLCNKNNELPSTLLEADAALESCEANNFDMKSSSKLCSNIQLLEERRASLISEDIESENDSNIWHSFLCQPIYPEDDKDNDPDYQITEEVMSDDDKLPFEKISRDELNDLVVESFENTINELNTLYNEEKEEKTKLHFEQEKILLKVDFPIHMKSMISVQMTPDERLQLDEQLRMHVQFLSQFYLMSHGNPDLQFMTVSTKVFLEQLKMYAMHGIASKGKSAFYAQNLDEALAIVKEFENKDPPLYPKKISQSKKKLPSLPTHVQKTLASSKVFIYPELLPTCGFRNDLELCKFFNAAEDNLIALGLEMFSQYQNPMEYIHNFLLPTKSIEQIKLRIKNSKSKKTPLLNPIKFYFQYKQAPPLPRVVRIFDPNNIKAPEDYSLDFLPKWMEPYRKHSKVRPILTALTPVQPITPSKKVTVHQECPKIFEPKKFSPILPRTMHFSPLKQISPILKKYSHQRRIVPIGSFNSASPLKKAPFILKAKPTPKTNKCSDQTANIVNPNIQQLLNSPADQKAQTLLTSCKTVHLPVKETHAKLKSEATHNAAKNKDSITHTLSSSATETVSVNESKSITAHPKVETADAETFDEGDEEALEDEQDSTSAVASTAATKKNSISKKRNRQQRDMEASLVLLQPSTTKEDPMNEEREVMFANSYLLRATEILKGNPEVYEQFLSTLSKYQLSDGSPVELYSELNEILKEYPALVKDFVVFLTPEQAKKCGRYKECIILKKIHDFFRKVEIHFKSQPQHITRILKAFTQLQQQVDITSADVINTLQPLLRNQTHLMEELNCLLPDVTPPEYLMTDFEDVNIPNSDEDDSGNDSCEEIIIPDTPDPYGGKNCPCDCHKSTTDNRLLSKIRHCVKCGVKFIDGRIYIQTGKVLKPAQVIYHDPPSTSSDFEKTNSEEKNSKIQQSSEISEKSPAESDLPSKPSFSKVPQTNDAAFQTIHAKAPVPETALKCNPLKEKYSNIDVAIQNTEDMKVSVAIRKDTILSCDPNLPSTSKLPCDVLEDAVFPTSGISSLNKSSPSDFSQIRNMIGLSKKDPSCAEVDNQPTLSRQNKQWTRDEDKLIIYNCQRYGITKKAICETANLIPTRTTQEVLNRFKYLMVFLSKVIKKQ